MHKTWSDTSFVVPRGKIFQSSSFLAAKSQASSFQLQFFLRASWHKSNEPTGENEALKKNKQVTYKWVLPLLRLRGFKQFSRVIPFHESNFS